MKEKLGVSDALSWVALISAGGLVSFAYSAYYQSLIREFSKFFDAHDKWLPDNYEIVKNKISIWGNCILCFSFAVFAIFYLTKWGLSSSTLLLSCMYFLSMFFKLHTFNVFIFLNAKKQVGFDKFLLFFGSFICLSISLLFLYIYPRVEFLALSSLISSAFVYIMAKKKYNLVIDGLSRLDGLNIELDLSEKIMILLLNLGGYLKLNTDVIISTYVLSTSDALQYAFWVKIFYMLVSLIGLWSQIRFPFWSIGENSFLKELKEIRIVLYSLVFFELMLLIGYFLGGSFDLFYFNDVFKINFLVIALIFISVFFAGATYAIDQLLMSKKAYEFLWSVIIISFISPLVAFSFAKIWGGLSFILGFILVHLLLFIIDLYRLKRLRLIQNQKMSLV